MIFEDTCSLKAYLLEKANVCFDITIKSLHPRLYTDNHHGSEWIFLKLNDTSRVRMTYDDNAELILTVAEDGDLYIANRVTKDIVCKGLKIEEALVHAPEQLFLGLYENCNVKCKFCPLAYSNKEVHYSLDSIYYDIDANIDKGTKSIGITTAIPPHLTPEDVGDELAFIIKKIREKVGNQIPIGVSTKIPSLETLELLHGVGANEIRLNVEIWDNELADRLMPNKNNRLIFNSIKLAVDVFGRGKVSSNMILGLGESDASVIEGIEKLAQIGAIATLYPYDPLPPQACRQEFERPTAERLVRLAKMHKEILTKYSLDPAGLKTMCPACAASHLYPGRDL